MDALVVIGRLGRTFGVGGWLRLYTSLSFSPREFSGIKSFFFRESAVGSLRAVALVGQRRYNNAWLIKLSGIDTPEVAKALVGREVLLPKSDLPKLNPGDFYWSDLKGLTVVNHKALVLGKITDLIATGANDVLVVEGERRYLIPYISNVVVKVDLTAAQLEVNWEKDV